MERSHTDRLEAELTLKDQYITGLEGDMKQMKAMHSKENMQYMRHTREVPLRFESIRAGKAGSGGGAASGDEVGKGVE